MSDVLRTYFKNSWYVDVLPQSRMMPKVSLDGDTFPAFLVWDITPDVIECPVFLYQHFLEARRRGCTKIVYNLINGPDSSGMMTFHQKTASAILAKFVEATETNVRLAHVVTTKGVHYYGAKGIILDGEYNPLMIATALVRFTADGSPRFSNPICNLSYRVFENSSELVEKTIIKQAIPLFGTIPINGDYDSHSLSGEAKVSIRNLDQYVVRPAAPSIIMASPTAFNSTIARSYANL